MAIVAVTGVAVELEELKNVLGEGTCADAGGDDELGDGVDAEVEEAGGVNAKGDSVNIGVAVPVPALGLGVLLAPPRLDVPTPAEFGVPGSRAVLGRLVFAFALTVAVAFAAACLKFDCDAEVVILDLSAGFDDVLLASEGGPFALEDVEVEVGVDADADAEVEVEADSDLDAVRRGEGLPPACADAGEGDDREMEGGGLRWDFEVVGALVPLLPLVDAAPAPEFEPVAVTTGFVVVLAELVAAFDPEVDVVRSLAPLVVPVRSRAGVDVVRSRAALEAVRSRTEVDPIVFSRAEVDVVRSLAVVEVVRSLAVVELVVRSLTALDVVRSRVEPGVVLLTAAEAVVLA